MNSIIYIFQEIDAFEILSVRKSCRLVLNDIFYCRQFFLQNKLKSIQKQTKAFYIY